MPTMLNPAHADFLALNDEMKALTLSRVQFLAGNSVTMRFRPYLEVFHLSKLLVPGVQIQIDMYFNDPNIWTIRWDGANTLSPGSKQHECETVPGSSQSGSLGSPRYLELPEKWKNSHLTPQCAERSALTLTPMTTGILSATIPSTTRSLTGWW